MFLSKLTLNPLAPEVQRDISDCHRLHQRVMSLFPDGNNGGRARYQVLHRLEALAPIKSLSLLVQSSVEPDWSRLPARYLLPGEDACQVKNLAIRYAFIRSGMVLRFRLLANVTRRVKSGPDGIRRNGRRLPVGGEERRLEWLKRKGVAGGFEVVYLQSQASVADLIQRPAAVGEVHGRHPAGRLTFVGVQFDGHLRILDAERFRASLMNGIGPAKAFGFGLMTVAPA